MLNMLKVSRPKPITLTDIADQAERAVAMMGEIRTAMLAPTARKAPPTSPRRGQSAIA